MSTDAADVRFAARSKPSLYYGGYVMNDVIRRWLSAVGPAALVCSVLSFGTGCGALQAAANPKVAWAVSDPAPMSVVVRRADVAEKTAEEVDRLMTDSPANDASEWLAQVTPEQESAAKTFEEIRAHDDLYAGGARVVAAEYWARALRSAPSKAEPGAPATPGDEPAEKAAEPAAVAAKEANSTDLKAKAAKNGAPKGALSETAEKDDAQSKTAPLEADRAAPAAEPTVAPKYPSLLAAIDGSLAASWSKVMEKKKAMGVAKGQIKVLEAENDDKGTAPATKTANKAKIKELEKQADALEDEAKKLAKEFVPQAKAAAQKASPETREKLGAILVQLRQAVDDASIANGAAAVRYPMAATSLLDSAKQMATVYVADVIEEKTGKRPSTQGIQPGVTLEGGKVQVTLNGLSQSDMGSLDAGELTTEVASRTTGWVKRAMGLLGTVAATKAMLAFEDDVLAALLDGFSASGWKAPAAALVPDAPAAAGAQPRS
jgi:hypothetical protein